MRKLVTVLGLVTPLLLHAQNLRFIARQDYGIHNAGALAIGDFNGDGIPDAVAGESSPSDAVCVFFGNGDGTFRLGPCTTTPGVAPERYATADLNGDGKLDLVFTNSSATEVYVLLGKGDGTFQPLSTVSITGYGYGIAVGDANGDRKLDLMVALGAGGINQGPQGVAVLPGNGDGTFGRPVIYPLGSPASAIVVADFNNDGKMDLAIGTSAGVSVLLGNNGGIFSAPLNVAFPRGVANLTTGDYNRDGRPDLAVTLLGDVPYVVVLLGSGDGKFAKPSHYSSSSPWAIATGDIDGDGVPDLVTAGGSNSVSILLGKGDGTFRPPLTYAVGSGPVAVYLADLRRNGRLDVVTANSAGLSLSVLLSRGNAKFQDGIQMLIGSGAYGLAEGDFNRDGHADAAVMGPNGVQIVLGTGNATAPYVAGASYSLPGAYSIVAGDFNRDGALDLAVSTPTGITILLGVGDGSFLVGGTFAGTPSAAFTGNLVAADLRQEGKLDLVTAAGTVLPGNGDGTFRPYRSVFNGSIPVWVTVGDFNGDGNPDLAFGFYAAPPGVAILIGNGDGTFQPRQDYELEFGPVISMLTADLNGDGKLDLAAATGGQIYLLFGNGDGTFQPPQTIQESFWITTSIVAGDYNGDGKLDLAVGNGSEPGVTILTGNGAGVFTYAGELGTESGPYVVVGTHNLLAAEGAGITALMKRPPRAAGTEEQ